MTSLEETFRTVLAARLPDDAKWAAWIDGTVQELAAITPPQGIDRAALIETLRESQFVLLRHVERLADRVLALVRPVAGVTITPDEAETVLGSIRKITDLERLGDNSRAIAQLNSLAQRLNECMS